MLACKRLRVDAGDGSPVEDYRIENGYVEVRILDFNLECDLEGYHRWQRLTREQLISHVIGNTALARWLQRRMGLHPLIRACAQPGFAQGEEESSPESLAA